MRADLSKNPDAVAAMFDEVAPGYDRSNALLSMGNSWFWRVHTTRALHTGIGQRVLDVAAGTGTSSAAIAQTGATVVAADFSAGMIAEGRRRHPANSQLSFVQADATRLPFAENEFDAVTISFGLRNVVDVPAALAEFYRVAKPGGRLVICEFSTPPNALVRFGYQRYLRWVMPMLARLSSSNTAAYDYLGESIAAWPTQRELAKLIRQAGFERVAWRNLSAGIVALHRAFKPGAAANVTAPDADAAPANAAQ